MPDFPCSIREASERLRVDRNKLGFLIREHEIPTTPSHQSPNAKMLDRAAYETLARHAAKYQAASVA